MFTKNIASPSKKSIALATVLLVGTVVTLPALAHRGGKDGKALTDTQRAEFRAQRQARMEERIRAELAPKIGLDEEQTNRLLASMQELGEQRRAARQKIRQERETPAELVESGAIDGQLSAQMARLTTAQAAMPQRGALLEETTRYLSAEQQAKLMLKLPKMMKHGKRGHHGKRGKLGGAGPGGFGGPDPMAEQDDL